MMESDSFIEGNNENNEKEKHDNCEEAVNQNIYDTNLIEQKRKDLLRDQEYVRKWIEEDELPPVKTSCKISKHIVSKER